MTKLNKDILYQRLNDALSPIMLDVIDESHLHIGHLGSSAGGHYRVRITAALFCGLGRLARHRFVYDALRDFWPTYIHALAIEAFAPDEAK